MKIAVILTCFNRREKTLSCLNSLFISVDKYNEQADEKISTSVYLTDDGCTDGTADAVKGRFPDKELNIIQGDGNLFWAGGMRLAWGQALLRNQEWDYYLLLNDDTDIFPNCIVELINTETFSTVKYNAPALVSGITLSKTEPYHLTYGGSIYLNKFLGTKRMLGKSEEPQMCDETNANIMLVPRCIVEKIGIFYKGYIHGGADYDYSMMARKAKYPVLITTNYCGGCDRDHIDSIDKFHKICDMGIRERMAYYRHPLHSFKQRLLACRRLTPFRTPVVFLGGVMRIFCPQIIGAIGNFRYNCD